MKILVTGGSGYIGSFMVKRLLEENHQVSVLDRNSSGFGFDNVEHIAGDLIDIGTVRNTLSNKSFDAVIHFAAVISMGESMNNPHKYFGNNTFGSLNLFEACAQNGVKKVIFSSTAGAPAAAVPPAGIAAIGA